MYLVELYLRVRRACIVDGMSIREASRMFGVHRKTVRKMLVNHVNHFVRCVNYSGRSDSSSVRRFCAALVL